jgi:glutathione S-transferase
LDIDMPFYTPIVTLLAVALYFVLATQVARARIQFGVELPNMTGDPHFERIFRAHVNTLEWMPTFLAPLWLCAIYLSDVGAAVFGLIWVAGRVLYFVGYRSAVQKRLPGFFVQSSACMLLFIGAIAGLIIPH